MKIVYFRLKTSASKIEYTIIVYHVNLNWSIIYYLVDIIFDDVL